MQWRIGEWTACSDTDSLRSNDVQRKIERRAMEALIALAERAGQVVMKDELIAAVWGRIAVSDHSVAMAISQLRRALGDDARAPRYIETITKRGYRLIAECERVAYADRPPLPDARARNGSVEAGAERGWFWAKIDSLIGLGAPNKKPWPKSTL
jgi:DNA-binding winged helix-turn-helix (wHTH) protein